MPSPPLAPEKQQVCREVFARTGSISEAARAAKCDRGTARRYVQDVTPPAPAPEVKPAPVDPVKVAEERAAKLRELAREREEITALAGERSFRAYLDALIRETVPKLDA